MNIYHKNRRHTCSICQLGFKRVESLSTHERRIHGKTGDYPNPTNRQTTVTAPLNTAISEEVFQTPTIELTCTGNLGIHDRLRTNSVQPIRVRAIDRHCRKMRRNNKFGAKNINLATTIGERKIASIFFCLASESSPPATSHCLVPLNGHQCVS